jgi:hypothetical protein
MPFDVLRTRLKTMTSRQHGTCRIWIDQDKQIHVIMTKDQW